MTLRNSDTGIEVVKDGKLGWSWGESGKTELKVKLPRATWVAGQNLWVDVGIMNDGSKKVSVGDLSTAARRRSSQIVP